MTWLIAPPLSHPSRVSRPLGVLSAAIPGLVALLRIPATAPWRGDSSLLHALGPRFGFTSGNVSTAAWQLFALLPAGPRSFRGALVSAVAIAIVGALLYQLALRSLRPLGGVASKTMPWLAPVFAALASLTATLGPTLQREATVFGGAAVATVLMLGTLLFAHAPDSWRPDFRRHHGVAGVFFGATMVETWVGAMAVAASLALTFRPSKPSRPWFVVGAIVPLLLTALLMLIASAFRSRWETDLASSVASLGGLAWPLHRPPGLGRWHGEIGEIGSFGLALAGAGVTVGLWKAVSRPLATALLPFVVLDFLAPATPLDQLLTDFYLPLRPVAVGALAISASVALFVVVARLLVLRPLHSPFARPIAAMLALLAVARVAVAFDESSTVLATNRGLEAWTDEALAHLPPSALVLARSRTLIDRVLAAQVGRGSRPDVHVVPLPLLGQAQFTTRLLAEQPDLAPLIRDLAVQGTPGEYALSQLADAHPLYMEVDPSWDRRVLQHLVAEHLWHRFQPQPAGASDRRLAHEAQQAAFSQVLQAATSDQTPDDGTRAVLLTHTQDQLLLARLLTDRSAAERAEALLAILYKNDKNNGNNNGPVASAFLTSGEKGAKVGPSPVLPLPFWPGQRNPPPCFCPSFVLPPFSFRSA